MEGGEGSEPSGAHVLVGDQVGAAHGTRWAVGMAVAREPPHDARVRQMHAHREGRRRWREMTYLSLASHRMMHAWWNRWPHIVPTGSRPGRAVCPTAAATSHPSGRGTSASQQTAHSTPTSWDGSVCCTTVHLEIHGEIPRESDACTS